MIELETERLRLEPVERRNAAALWRLMQAPKLRDYQDIPRFALAEFVERVAARPRALGPRAIGRFEWIVRVAETRAAIGWVSLRLGDHPRGTAELGYTLLAPHRGRGYASEAVGAVVASAFATRGIDIVEACCLPGNASSRRLLERCGFARVRYQPAGAMIRGRPADIVIYRLGREAFVSSRSMVMPASAKP